MVSIVAVRRIHAAIKIFSKYFYQRIVLYHNFLSQIMTDCDSGFLYIDDEIFA